MADSLKKRGRPKKVASKEMERITTLLNNPPAHIKKLNVAQQNQLNQDLLKNDQIEKEIYKSFGVGAYVSKNLALEMEAVGDEASKGFEKEILGQYSEAQEALKNSRLNGSSQTQKNALDRAAEVWDKNTDLLEAIFEGRRTLDGAVKLIKRNWEVRGDGGPSPAINTIKNWLKSLNIDQRLISK
jgi:hypothetical protein